jgi:hypothetical protein
MGIVARYRRWLPVVVAGSAVALLATGFGLAADQVTAAWSTPAPQLRTVPPAALARLGLRLTGASQPPYCGVTDTTVGRAVLPPGSIACPVSRRTAEMAATRGGRTHTVESVLALVTSPSSAVGRYRLAWVVVTQPAGGCPLSSGRSVLCPAGGFGAWNQVVVVDARTAGVVDVLRVSGRRPGTGGRS